MLQTTLPGSLLELGKSIEVLCQMFASERTAPYNFVSDLAYSLLLTISLHTSNTICVVIVMRMKIMMMMMIMIKKCFHLASTCTRESGTSKMHYIYHLV